MKPSFASMAGGSSLLVSLPHKNVSVLAAVAFGLVAGAVVGAAAAAVGLAAGALVGAAAAAVGLAAGALVGAAAVVGEAAGAAGPQAASKPIPAATPAIPRKRRRVSGEGRMLNHSLAGLVRARVSAVRPAVTNERFAG